MTLSGWYRTFFFFFTGSGGGHLFALMSHVHLVSVAVSLSIKVVYREFAASDTCLYLPPPKKLPLFLPYKTKRLEQILGNPCWNGNGNILTLLVSEDWHCTYCNSLRRELPCDLLFWYLQERIARFVVLITTDSMFLYTPSWEDYGVFQNTKDSSRGPKSLFHLPPPTTFSRRGGRDCRAMFLIMKITVS